MEIKYCDNCGSRITSANPECMIGEKSHCDQCAPKSNVLETAAAAPTRPRRNTPGNPTTRRTASQTQPNSTARTRGAITPDTGSTRSSMPLILLGVGAVVFLVGIFVVLMGGKSTPPATSASTNSRSTSTASTETTTPPASSTPAANPWAKPKDAAAPSNTSTTTAPSTTTTPASSNAPTFVPRTASDDEAKKLFAPIKKDYERALATDDLKAMRKVVSDLGTVTRDYPNTPTYDKAMELIGHANEARSAIQLRDMQKELKRTISSNGWSEPVADLMSSIERFCRDRTRKDTKAAQMAMDELKKIKNERAAKIFAKIKPKLEGDGISDARLDAMDEVGYLYRNFRGTQAANEATKLVEKFHKEAQNGPPGASWISFHKDMVFAPSARELRGNINMLTAFIDSGMADDPELSKLLPRGLKMLGKELTPKNREKKQWRVEVSKFGGRFLAFNGTHLSKGKVGDQVCVAVSAPADKTHVRLMCPLFIAEENAQLSFKYSAPGLKNLTFKIFSNSHKRTFDHSIKKLPRDFDEGVVDLAKISDGEYSLRNAVLSMLIIEGEKTDPAHAEPVLHFLYMELKTGRK